MSLSFLQAALLSAFSLLLAGGQVLFKYAAETSPRIETATDLLSLATNTYLWAALALYGAATVLWVYILQRVPLSVAYPFVALAFVLVPIAAWLVFGDVLSRLYILGMAFVVAGLYLASFRSG